MAYGHTPAAPVRQTLGHADMPLYSSHLGNETESRGAKGPHDQNLIADDSLISRRAFWDLSKSQPDFEVVGTAASGFEAIVKIRDLLPDVVTMDALMPTKGGGAEATRLIKEVHPWYGSAIRQRRCRAP